jgi:hypothetical protein
MAKERLSKLQKWILAECMKQVFLHRGWAMEFYGKEFYPGAKARTEPSNLLDSRIKKEELKFYDSRTEMREWYNWEKKKHEPRSYTILTPKSELVSTKAEQVSITRSFKNLEKKGFITRPRKWGSWQLTEKGFLIAKKWEPGVTFLNFKDYCDKLQELEQAREKRYSKMIASMGGSMDMGMDENPERTEKVERLRAKAKQYQETFTSEAIFKLCCDECQKKIMEFQKECGIEEVNALTKEIESYS